MKSLFQIASKAKTPLSIAGIIIIAFYLIAKQILSLNIFSKLNSDKTSNLLQNILDDFFWLAVIALVLGIASYIFTIAFKRKADLKLINARNDSDFAEYEQENLKNGTTKIVYKGKK